MNLSDKTILVTGGTGSLGKGLLTRISDAKEIRIFSRSETGQLLLKSQSPNVKFILGDVRDKLAVKRAVAGCDIVIHAAAFKFLDLAEHQVREAVLSNVVGSLNVVEAVEEDGHVEICLGISTDKSVYARSVYGCTKHIMEKLFREANNHSFTIFTCVRYGNVLSTTGSVVPIWQRQKAAGKPLAITDKRMRRFFFSLDEAVQLVMYALDHSVGGEVFTMKMKSYSLYDMAKEISDDVIETGIRPGEKLYETLIADYENNRGEEFTSRQSGNGEIVILT